MNIKEILKKYNVVPTGVIQAGGHFGQEIEFFASLGNFPIEIFEPCSSSFAVLKKKERGEIRLHKKALGSHCFLCDMNVSNDNRGQLNSLLPLGTHVIHFPNIKLNKKERVEVISLDSTEFERNLYNFFFIDVQGYELEVLRGATEFLPFVDIIICEVSKEELYLGCPKVFEVDSFLKEYNFSRKETYWRSQNYGDAVYIKE